jgi:hypothetical protein
MTTQNEIDRRLRWGIIFSILWLAGIGSLIAVWQGYRAKNLIVDSQGSLVGNGRVWWCLIVGAIGLVIWIPILAIGVFNNVAR